MLACPLSFFVLSLYQFLVSTFSFKGREISVIKTKTRNNSENNYAKTGKFSEKQFCPVEIVLVTSENVVKKLYIEKQSTFSPNFRC